MTLRFLDAAQADLREAFAFYEGQRPGLGTEFTAQVRSAVERIQSFPEAWHPLSANTRRCRTQKFPFGVIYQVRPDEILVIAVAHLHREPVRWGDRV